jgi:hypothetical protein
MENPAPRSTYRKTISPLTGESKSEGELASLSQTGSGGSSSPSLLFPPLDGGMDSSPFTLVGNYRTLEPGSEKDIGAREGIVFFDTLGEH